MIICKLCKDNPEQTMRVLAIYDNPQPKPGHPLIAYNAYQCEYCGAIAIEHVWSNKGIMWISVEGRIRDERGFNV